MLLVSLVFRASAVFSKFGLAAVVSTWCGLSAFGVLTLLISFGVVYSKLAGFGFYFYANREQVGGKDRFDLLFSQYSLYFFVNVLLLFFLIPLLDYFKVFNFSLVLVGAILVSEHLAHETHQSLLAAGRVMLANGLFCFRALGWFLSFLVVGYIFPGLRSIELAVECWVLCNWISLVVVGGLFLFGWRRRGSSLINPVPMWRKGLRVAARYYLLAVTNALALHGDRFVIAYFCEARLLGVYGLLWSFSNALQTIVANSIHLGALKEFLKAGRESRLSELNGLVVRAIKKSVLLVFVFSLLLYFLSVVGAALDARLNVIVQWMPLFALLSFGSVVKIVSDIIQQALYALGQDRDVVRVGVIAFFFSFVALVPAVAFFGVYGAGGAYSLAVLVSAVLYWKCIRGQYQGME